MIHTNRNHHLDWVRGISALIVCAGHTRNALLPDFVELPTHGLIEQLIYFVTGFGHAAVMVFFVMSGYLVGGSVLSTKVPFNWWRYLVSRYIRLWMVLLPALIWTWLVDQQTLALAPQVLQGGLEQNWHSLPAKGEYSTTFSTFLLNLLFQQTVVAPVFGSNGPLWSLANEAWYYLLFPLLVVPIFDRRWWVTLTHWPLAAAILFFMPKDMLWLLPVWVAGALLRKLPPIFNGRLGFGVVTATGFSVVLVAYKKFGQTWFDAHAWDGLIGLSFTLFAAYLIQNPGGGYGNHMRRMAIRLSDFSYSLYLIHMPLAMLSGAVFSVPRKRAGDTGDFFIFIGVVVVEVMLAYAFWWMFENRTSIVKDWLLKLPGVEPK
jgi:peptidoglycan/LPS O-acetylase OafA/YrhL